MAEINPYAAPRSDVALDIVSPGSDGGAWRDGELLVARKGAVLPDRCVKCNAPARWPISLYLRWNEPVYFLGVRFPSFVNHSARITIKICTRHRRRGWMAVAASWRLFLPFLGWVLIESTRGAGHVVPARLASVITLGCPPSLVAAMFCAGFVLPQVGKHQIYKIDADYVWLKKLDPGYVAQFPPFAG